MSTVRALMGRILRHSSVIMTPLFTLKTSRRRSSRNRKVLLVAQSQLMWETVAAVWELLRDDERLTARLATPWNFRKHGRQLAFALEIRHFTGLIPSLFRWWDLVVVADHVPPYHRRISVMFVQHGMGSSSKVVKGEDYSYGPRRVLRKDGTPAYTFMAETSDERRQRVLSDLPQLAGVVETVGDLRADRLVRLAQERQELRRHLGFGGEAQVVVIMSTFGPNSLIERIGQALMDEAKRLASEGRYVFVVSTHPNLWGINPRQTAPWDEFLKGLQEPGMVVLEPGDDWMPYLAVADLAVSDHTSLSVGFALLSRPIIFVDVPQGVIAPGSAVARLMNCSPRLHRPEALEYELVNAVQRPVDPEVRVVAESVFSGVGMAGERLRSAAYKLLDLEEPRDYPAS